MESYRSTERTHTGQVRDHNEDAVYADAAAGLWIVADGMGGHIGGEIASAITVNAIRQEIANGAHLEDAVQAAHARVLASVESSEGAPGMGATVVALKADGVEYELAWVGDSRAYIWDGQQLRQLSRDHSFVQSLVDSGAISAQEARGHPESSVVTQAIGSEDRDTLAVDVIKGRFLQGQQILLCSDGLSDMVDDEQIAAVLSDCSEQGQAAQADALIEAALANGGSDNVTVAIVDAPSDAPARSGTAPRSADALNEAIAAEAEVAPWRSRWWISLCGVLAVAFVAGAGLYWWVQSGAEAEGGGKDDQPGAAWRLEQRSIGTGDRGESAGLPARLAALSISPPPGGPGADGGVPEVVG